MVSERNRDVPWFAELSELKLSLTRSQQRPGATQGIDDTENEALLNGCSPDEHPFTSDLPKPVLPPLQFPNILYQNGINVNQSILSFYVLSIVPRISRRATLRLAAQKRAAGITGDEEYEDDGNYGSAATVDVEVLQAISKRVHYGQPVDLCLFKLISHRKIRLRVQICRKSRRIHSTYQDPRSERVGESHNQA